MINFQASFFPSPQTIRLHAGLLMIMAVKILSTNSAKRTIKGGNISMTPVLPLMLLSILTMLSFSCLSCAEARKPKRPSSINFYMRDTLQEKTKSLNTAFEIAAPNGNLTGLKFGAMIVFDDPLTEEPSPTSKRVGRGQGTYVYDNMYTGFSALLGFSAIIDTPQYNGTINFFGADRLLLPTRDISVVGGTGDFELARGIATITTNSIKGATVFVIHFKVRLYY